MMTLGKLIMHKCFYQQTFRTGQTPSRHYNTTWQTKMVTWEYLKNDIEGRTCGWQPSGTVQKDGGSSKKIMETMVYNHNVSISAEQNKLSPQLHRRQFKQFRWSMACVLMEMTRHNTIITALLRGNGIVQINEVTQRQARLVLAWVTVSGFNSRCGTFIQYNTIQYNTWLV